MAINAISSAVLASSLKTSAAGFPPITKLRAGSYVAFKIKPEQIRVAVYGSADPGGYADIFESLESFELQPA